MNEQKRNLIKAALLIYEHCQKNKCETCPFLLRDPDEPDDTFSCECRLDASCPTNWDVYEKMLEE